MVEKRVSKYLLVLPRSCRQTDLPLQRNSRALAAFLLL